MCESTTIQDQPIMSNKIYMHSIIHAEHKLCDVKIVGKYAICGWHDKYSTLIDYLIHHSWRVGGYDGVYASFYITLDIIKSFPQIKWNYFMLCMNPGITNYDIFDNPHLFNDGFCISMNSNITWRDIKDHPEINWEMFNIFDNPLNRTPAAIKIQRAWYKYILTKTTVKMQRLFLEHYYKPNSTGMLKRKEHFENFQKLQN